MEKKEKKERMERIEEKEPAEKIFCRFSHPPQPHPQ